MTITSRIDAITKIPASRLAVSIPVPRSVKIELTSACDFKCFFCATGKNLRPKQNMDFGLFRRLALEMRQSGVEELGLFYLGESFLYKQLPEAIAFAKHEAKFPYVFLTTNGRMATYERLEACMRAGLDSLKFSFNWADKAQCAEVTGVDAFETCLEHLKLTRIVRDKVQAETGHRCGLYASSIEYDGDQKAKMDQTAAILRKYVDEHYYLPLYNQAGYTTVEESKRGLTPTAGNQGRVGALRDPLPCWAVFTEGHITADGKLSACCFDHTNQFEMADLTQTSFAEGWNSVAFQNLRAAHLRKDVRGTACEGCIAYQ